MTGFPQLLCGWALVNLESSGAGVGVVARSGNWPAALGSTVRELGSLVTLPDGEYSAAPESFVLEFRIARGLAVAGLKTPSDVRPGTCITHLIAGECGALDGITALWLHESGELRTSLNGSDSPNEHWPPADPAPEPDEQIFAAATAAALVDPWLPVLVGSVLAHLAGQGPGITLHVAGARDAVTMMKALYGILPRDALRELTFSTGPGQPSEALSIVTAIGRDTPPPDRVTINPDSSAEEPGDTYQNLGRTIVEHRRAGIALPSELATVHEIRQWCYQQHLRTVDPALLDDAQLVQVITDPGLAPEWFDDTTIARRAIHLALDKTGVTSALAHMDHLPSVRTAFEQTLIECVMNDNRRRNRATQVAHQLGFDISEVVTASAFQRLETGTLTASDAKTVWPQLQHDWTTGEAADRSLVVERLQQHRALREFTIGSRDRALVYETVRAEINDPAVHTGSSQLLRSAMYTHLPIVAQLMVNASCTSRDRYLLEQLMACAPADRLAPLITECMRYTGVDAFELMKAVTIVRAEPAELVEALQPAWPALRRTLGLPQALETLTVLDAEQPEPTRSRLRHSMFQRSRNRGSWTKAEVSGIIHAADDDPLIIEENFEILRAAIDSDMEFVAACMSGRSTTAGGAPVLQQILGCVSREQLPALITTCARQRDLEPLTLLHAVCALEPATEELVTVLAGGWPYLRIHFDLPRRIANLVSLDPTAAHPPRLQPLERPKKARRTLFGR
ncbi:MAG: hypothetical protein JWN03_2799 [Nocardia sp.]|uniref:GAP1-M domain-containing protein n=1 Tax=Nocardia sp. TaxID=1821 RepID=UPI0026387666|nr:hypothetical protein [Nocardia sp.]MCU1642524.1 hypothetical protein [Nocardia sp.]